jgi:hypothetical protein
MIDNSHGIVLFSFIQDAQNLIRLRLHFLAIQADRPDQLGVVAMEVNLNCVHYRSAATPHIAHWTGHVFRKFAFAIDNCQPAIGKLQSKCPIATGVIEGACGYLVEARMNRSGARWSLTGAEAVLRLRALRASGDFDKYWEFHENQEYQRNHAANYADQDVPKVVPPPAPSSNTKRPPALKIIKK